MALDGKQVAFLPPEADRTLPGRIWAMAALVVLLALGIAAVATLRQSDSKTGAIRGPDPYASNLSVANMQMSEATNGTGGKATYVDGTITNVGTRLVTGALVQVTFAMVDGSAYRETLPLALVRTRVPYVDLEQLSGSPLRPAQQRDFRLIFESIPANWDVKPPSIQIVHADLK